MKNKSVSGTWQEDECDGDSRLPWAGLSSMGATDLMNVANDDLANDTYERTRRQE